MAHRRARSREVVGNGQTRWTVVPDWLSLSMRLEPTGAEPRDSRCSHAAADGSAGHRHIRIPTPETGSLPTSQGLPGTAPEACARRDSGAPTTPATQITRGLVIIRGVDDLRIRHLDAGELDLIEPLWNALREHHSDVTPELGTPRTREESWRRRRGQYEAWLEGPDAFVLVAEREGRPIGYAMVHIREGSPTWPLSERAGEVETLSVLPGARGRGAGTALLQAVRDELGQRGATELSLHVMTNNRGAIRFYEREGFQTYALWVRADIERSERDERPVG
jgi:ribosomal protein S18 acetylase RimI-like enzyme